MGEREIIKQELRDLLASMGELRLAVGALMERVERLEQNSIDIDRRWTGSIQGLDGDWTVTPPPEWEQAAKGQ